MRKLILVVLFVALGPGAAVAKSITATGPAALALAAVVAEHSRLVSAFHKRVVARLFGGDTHFGFTPGRKISVTADSIMCKTSNVDITERTCDLTFSVGKRSLRGREANELSATAAVAGAPSEGAAGSVIESFSKLDCTIDPNEIMQKAGGGAQCTFDAGP
jgi:hypothetical protein